MSYRAKLRKKKRRKGLISVYGFSEASSKEQPNVPLVWGFCRLALDKVFI